MRRSEDDLAERRALVVDVPGGRHEPGVVERVRSSKRDLLLRREEKLDTCVAAPLSEHAPYRFEHHHDRGLVVGAEDRAGGVADDPVLVDHRIDRSLRRNGVRMCAQEDRRPLSTVRRRDAAVHVPGIAVQPRGGVVLVPLEPQVGQVGGDPVSDRALGAGRARHRAQLEEEVDERRRQRWLIHAGSIPRGRPPTARS